jgi:chromosome segregation ATPase
MFNNPALTNLERELKEEETKLNQIKNTDKEVLAKNIALNAQIKTHEEEIRRMKAEIAKLELEIKQEGNEIKKNSLEDTRLKNEIHSLEQKKQSDHFRMTKLTRDQADAVRKAEQEKRIHPDIHSH